MNFCPNCGTRVNVEMQFCFKCGGALKPEVPPQKPVHNVDFPPPPVVRPFRNTNSSEIPDVSPYRMTLESGYSQPNSTTQGKDGYIPPKSSGATRENTYHHGSSRITEESVIDPSTSSEYSSVEIAPPPLGQRRNAASQNNGKSIGYYFKKFNPLMPAKHFFITLLVVAAVWAGSYYFDDVAGVESKVVFEWDISKDAVIQRLNYQNISNSSKGNESQEVIAEIISSTIDLPIKKEILKGQKLRITYFFDNANKLNSISILIPQIKREEIYTLSQKIGEYYTFDPTNSNPTEFTYYKNDTKLWFIVRKESGNNVEGMFTLSKR